MSSHLTRSLLCLCDRSSLSQYLGPELLDMIPMAKPAEQAGMDHLLTNYWMGKGASSDCSSSAA